jgi:hypothetical protein
MGIRACEIFLGAARIIGPIASPPVYPGSGW